MDETTRSNRTSLFTQSQLSINSTKRKSGYGIDMKIISLLWLAIITLILASLTIKIEAAQSYDAVYFSSKWCTVCQALDQVDHAFERMEDQGIILLKYTLEDDPAYTQIFSNYQFTYDVKKTSALVPILFIGEQYFQGRDAINEAIDSGVLVEIKNTETMPTILTAPPSDFSLVYFILLGFVDGVNPCAIAMLLIFISMLGFTQKKRVLLGVSLTFIATIFISYFLFGTLLFQYMNRFKFLSFFVSYIPWIIIGFTAILFFLNIYDFIVTLLQKYDLVKNQLPRGIQKFNRRLMAKFTQTLEEKSIKVYGVTVLIGIIISFTEFLCTGQAYLTAILHLIHFTDYLGRGVLLLFIYNLIFVLPLIIITLIALKTQQVVTISVFMREKLHWIKLLNALIFLAICIYYLVFMI